MTKQQLTADEARDLTNRLREALRDAVLQPVPGKNRQPPIYTYFIQADGPVLDRYWPGGPIKIGCAADPAARLLQLQTASPCELRLMGYAPGGQKLERELHRKYAALHLRGEWFRATEDLEHALYMMIFDYEEECLG